MKKKWDMIASLSVLQCKCCGIKFYRMIPLFGEHICEPCADHWVESKK